MSPEKLWTEDFLFHLEEAQQFDEQPNWTLFTGTKPTPNQLKISF